MFRLPCKAGVCPHRQARWLLSKKLSGLKKDISAVVTKPGLWVFFSPGDSSSVLYPLLADRCLSFRGGLHTPHRDSAFPSKTVYRSSIPAKKNLLTCNFCHLSCKTDSSSSRYKIKSVRHFFKLEPHPIADSDVPPTGLCPILRIITIVETFLKT